MYELFIAADPGKGKKQAMRHSSHDTYYGAVREYFASGCWYASGTCGFVRYMGRFFLVLEYGKAYKLRERRADAKMADRGSK